MESLCSYVFVFVVAYVSWAGVGIIFSILEDDIKQVRKRK